MNKFKKFTTSLFGLSLLLSCSSCSVGKNALKATKIAVFADNQLAIGGGGGTAYSDVYLKNHLKLCKEQNVDVIMMCGDLVNNVVENYYRLFETSLKEVYGTDSSQYPEFVYSMGNHEWYTNQSSEQTDPKAIKMFKKFGYFDTDAIRAKSEAIVTEQTDPKVADYYKVVNGIPFIAISGCNCSGLISSTEREEIKGWLEDISKLPAVKKGAPIFVSYHYAIKDISYGFGQGASLSSSYLDDLLKDYPQAIVFTGDTHYAGANERTINQVNYTTINLGSSCYSRHVSCSCTMDRYLDSYYNIVAGNSSKDTLSGEVADNFNKTPHIHIVEVDKKGNTKLNRYFSTSDPTSPTHLGLEWNIPAHTDTHAFIYNSSRYENKEWAQKMYGQDGLTWKEGTEATYTQSSDGITVKFPDCENYNYCEHYRIKINAETSKTYDFVSHYYKWEETAHNYSFFINKLDFPSGQISSIEVQAFDFFDNPSLNSLRIYL